MVGKYHINPETGNVLPCKAKHKCRFGDEGAHYDSAEEGRAAYEAKAKLSVLTVTLGKNRKKLSKGAQVLLALDRAHHAIVARLEKNVEEGRDPYSDGEGEWRLASAQVDERNRLQKKLEHLPWDHSDEPDFDDSVKLDFSTLEPEGDEPRRGFDKDAFTPDGPSKAMYEALDRASAAWVARLSTAEVKAVALYNIEAKFYAQAMAGQEVTLREWDRWDPEMIQYLHSAVAKAPRAVKPFRAYAGISGERAVGINEEARAGKIELNRIQSASANPAQVNGFMTPSDWKAEQRDETSVEFKTDRIASLSAFNIHKDEMELLVAPGAYRVEEKLSGVSYFWGGESRDGKDFGKTADHTYVVTEIKEQT